MTPQVSTRQVGTNGSLPLERASSTGAVPTYTRSMSSGDGLVLTPKNPKRKPVPGLAIANASLPASHPFALSLSNPAASTPTTPLSARFRNEDELFYVAPRNGPVPPVRSRAMSPSLASHYSGTMAYPPVDEMGQMAGYDHGMYNSNSGQGYSSYPSSQGHGSVGHSREDYGEEYDRNDALSARERALIAKEQELQRREEFLRREEALRQREDELRAREEAFALRERAASPINQPPSPGPTFAYPYRDPSYLAPKHFDAQLRPLPPVPEPSRSNLRDSTESLPPITPADTPNRDVQHARHGAAGLAQKLKLSRRSISTPHPTTVTRNKKPEAVKEKQLFSVDAPPLTEDILEARTLFLRDEQGSLVCFGDLFPDPSGKTVVTGDFPLGSAKEDLPPITKTVVFFIRHFWCGQCQDYTFASLSLLDPLTIRKAGVRVVVISNGSWKIIKAYRRILKCPFPIYVDGPRKLYNLLGMTKMTNDFGPMFKNRAAYHQSSVPAQLFHGAATAIKMPLANPGKFTQLGGEFIFSTGTTCEFAHRMSNTSDHMEAPEVMRLAGVLAPTVDEARGNEIKEAQQAELDRMKDEMEQWRLTREAELERIKRKKAERRGISYNPTRNDSNSGLPEIDSEDDAIDQLNAAMERSAAGEQDVEKAHDAGENVVLGPEISGQSLVAVKPHNKGTHGAEVHGKPAAGEGALHVTVDDQE